MEFIFNDDVQIPLGNIQLEGKLAIPATATGIVIFSNASANSRFSDTNTILADNLRKRNFGTLLFDLLTPQEDRHYHNRFDINLLTRRLIGVTIWLEGQPFAREFPLGFFSSGTGTAAALKAAGYLPQLRAIVSRGGRPDLALEVLGIVQAPTLLIAGSLDLEIVKVTQEAYTQLYCSKKMEIIEGATHSFEEPGRLEQVYEKASEWFGTYLQPAEIEN